MDPFSIVKNNEDPDKQSVDYAKFRLVLSFIMGASWGYLIVF